MTEKLDYELAVIGGGLAGLSVAVRASELGCRTAVFERGPEGDYLCNSRLTGGLFHIAMDDMTDDEDIIKKRLKEITSDLENDVQVKALSETAHESLEWMKKKGVRIIKAGPDGLRKNALAPPGVRSTGYFNGGKPYWQGRSGDVMLKTLSKRLNELGGEIVYNAAAVDLIVASESKCIGVIVEKDGKKTNVCANNVVIADGGFQANKDLIKKYISNVPGALMQRNAGSGLGNGILMAEKIGAKTIGEESFYGHLLYKEALNDDRFWPYPVIDSLATGSMIVDENGRRFCDEGMGGVYITNQVARLRHPLSSVVIFDSTAWEHGPGKDWLIPPNPFLIKAGGKLIEGQSIAKLSEQLDIPEENLKSTIDAHNYFVEQGFVKADEPVRTVGSVKSYPIKTPPFYAIPVCAGITYTMGGILTNENGQVINKNDDVIEGLFAVGACTGGLEGGGSSGYSGGLSKALVFGYRAGTYIASNHR
ncbi:exported protein [Halomonas sp. HAL1]|uniref:FAD-dependent oxidoreductase n=1 Tax=Halomonas sp. HAL1 TaxID=550984 RepID=UPI00022D303F|nr:FAD-dependent oxidoreductase [Halomonas sp. HAL1]EHA13644.1 exported protein [Halomonas sp. HAL1]